MQFVPYAVARFDEQGYPLQIANECENSYDALGDLIQVKRQNTGSDTVVTYHYIYGYVYTLRMPCNHNRTQCIVVLPN